MIKALFKFDKHIPKDAVVVDTTSNTHPDWKYLSPFVLEAPPAKNLENLWQFSKVYQCHVGFDGLPNQDWHYWRTTGWSNPQAQRYPMGKGTKPIYSYWKGLTLDYINARKLIYIPEYAGNVIKTSSFRNLVTLDKMCVADNKLLVLLDYDAYDHQALGMTLKDVANNPDRIMGHAFVLVSLLTGERII